MARGWKSSAFASVTLRIPIADMKSALEALLLMPLAETRGLR